jgi:antitoxin YefM
MTAISYTEAREQLATIWDQTVETREPIVINRRGNESVVLLPLDEWEGMQETAHLLRSPENARRLLSALLRCEAGEGERMTAEELASSAGLHE